MQEKVSIIKSLCHVEGGDPYETSFRTSKKRETLMANI